MYMGIAPFFIFHASWWWIPIVAALLIAAGLLPSIQRIPARSLLLLTLSILFLAEESFQYVQDKQPLKAFCTTFLQAYLLLQNSHIYPSFPFNQWWNKPSKLYSQKPKSYNWPFVTGYREGVKISDYVGAFRLAN